MRSFFAGALIEWYRKNLRDLPWRNTRDPYAIWLSEVILQQTRVAQGLPYYERFLEAYPTAVHMAAAPQEEVLRLWQGLGYYSRARNMHQTAKIIAAQGYFPGSYDEWLKMKGVGKYTAAAVASFAFDEPVAVLDGNVFRVLARVFGIEEDIASSKGQKIFAELARSLLPPTQSAVYNQAVMEFGALHCKPQKPLCMFCPLHSDCEARKQGKQNILPVKLKKTAQKEFFFQYLVFRQEEKIALRRRQGEGIWEGLYDFYLKESRDAFLSEETLCAHFDDLTGGRIGSSFVSISPVFMHQLTHKRIYAKFYEVRLLPENDYFFEDVSLQWLDNKALEAVPKPVLIVNYLQSIGLIG